MKRPLMRSRLSRQTGAVLAIGLVVLLVLTLLGTGSINSVRFEEKMTANLQSLGMAFEGAEAGLVQCETDIRVSSFAEIESKQIALNSLSEVGEDGSLSRWWEDFGNWDETTRSRIQSYEDLSGSGTGSGPATAALTQEPSCVIEYVGKANPSLEFAHAVSTEAPASRHVYRVTAFSYGADQRSSAVVESIYAK